MKPKVLIIDDEKSMGDLLEADLKLRDFQTRVCMSAAEALGAMEGEAFDVALTDLKMPEMDGIELCQWIVANRPDIPVVVMTAFGSMETAIAAIRAGA